MLKPKYDINVENFYFLERGQRNLPAMECDRGRHKGRVQQLPHGRQTHSKVDDLSAQGR